MSTGLLTMSSGIKIEKINTQRSTVLGVIVLIPAKHELQPEFYIKVLLPHHREHNSSPR